MYQALRCFISNIEFIVYFEFLFRLAHQYWLNLALSRNPHVGFSVIRLFGQWIISFTENFFCRHVFHHLKRKKNAQLILKRPSLNVNDNRLVDQSFLGNDAYVSKINELTSVICQHISCCFNRFSEYPFLWLFNPLIYPITSQDEARIQQGYCCRSSVIPSSLTLKFLSSKIFCQ